MVGVSGAIAVALLTRAPSARGKTRLFRALGCDPDPDLLGALFLDTLAATDVPGLPRTVYVTPDDALAEMRALVPDGVRLRPQRDGDLGARMRAAFDDLLGDGAAGVLLIGSDLPLLSRAALADARDVLASRPACVIVGPAGDGGYYLIGATRTPAPLFADVEWGTAAVLDRTIALANDAGLEIVYAPTVRDVDTADDLHLVLQSDVGAVHTRQWAAAHEDLFKGRKE